MVLSAQRARSAPRRVIGSMRVSTMSKSAHDNGPSLVFSDKPATWWANAENQRNVLAYIQQERGNDLSVWYNATKSWFTKVGAQQLLSMHGNSIVKLVTSNFPEHNWQVWKFQSLPSEWWTVRANVVQFFESLRQTMDPDGSKGLEVFFDLTKSIIEAHDGQGLLKHFGGNFVDALRFAYPDHEWDLWKFQKTAIRSWDKQVYRDFLLSMAPKLGIKTMEDWYKISYADLKRADGNKGFMKRLNYSPPLVVMTAFPEHPWLEWKFKAVPRHFWNELPNQRKFMDWLAKSLGFVQMSDWYRVTYEQISLHGGATLLKIYKYSPIKALQAIYSDHKWEIWRFSTLPRNWWQNADNQRQYMMWLAKELGIDDKPLDAWYDVPSATFDKMYGRTLLELHGGSTLALLRTVFPHHNWLPWKFKLPPQWMDNPTNLRQLLDWMGAQIGIQTLSDWYSVDMSKIKAQTKLRNRLIEALQKAYPEHKWHVWKFAKTPQRFWHRMIATGDTENLREYLKDLAKELGLGDNLEEWYRVSYKQIGTGHIKVITLFGGLRSALKKAFPEHNWRDDLWHGANKAAEQRNMKKILAKAVASSLNVPVQSINRSEIDDERHCNHTQ